MRGFPHGFIADLEKGRGSVHVHQDEILLAQLVAIRENLAIEFGDVRNNPLTTPQAQQIHRCGVFPTASLPNPTEGENYREWAAS